MTIAPISTRLRAWREDRKMTRMEAAQRLDVPWRTLERWEQGRNEPRGLALKTIEKVLSREHRKPNNSLQSEPLQAITTTV